MAKILHINTSLNCNSTGKIVEQIGLLAMSEGWDCYIAHGPRYKIPSALKTYEISSAIGEKWHFINSLLFDAHGLSSKRGTIRLVEWIKEIKPDIIHLHNIHGYYINYPILFDYLSKAEKPIVWTLHDCWSITGHCTFFEGVGCERWKTGCGHCIYMNDYPKTLFIDRSARNYRLKKTAFTSPNNLTIVSVSDWLGHIVKESYLGIYPVHVIHNGTDLNIFKPQESDIRARFNFKNETIVLGIASVWHERKGLSDFIKLAEDKKNKVILVGVTEKIQKKLPSSIISIRRTNNQQELAKLYSGADIFVNPTYDDNFPTTNIEALACGTPVVTYRTGGSHEAIDDETGIVVNKGDFCGLKQAIESIRNNGKFRYSAACRKRAEEYFNKDDRFMDYINLYKELLNEKGCSR